MNKAWIIKAGDNGIAEIFLYGFIDSFDVSAGDFVKELRSLEKENTIIHVRINSGGGSVFEGLAIYNAMKQSHCTIETFVDGVAASMASIIAMGGSKCHMSKSARIMTHQPSTGSYGNKEEHEKNIKLLEGVEKTMLAIYAAKTGKTEEDCKASFMSGSDCWFDADQALAAGLIDNIYDAEPVQMPKNATTEKQVFDTYNQKFAAVFNHSNNNMKQYQISSAVLMAMSLTAEADTAAIEAKITDLVAKAALADTYKTDKEAAEQKLADAEKKVKTDKVTDLLATAKNDKKISEAVATQLKADYAENPDGLKVILDGLVAYKPVKDQLKENGSERLQALVAKSYAELDKAGELPELQALDMEAFKTKFKEEFKTEYKG